MVLIGTSLCSFSRDVVNSVQALVFTWWVARGQIDEFARQPCFSKRYYDKGMGGLTFEKLLIVLVIALVIVGPDKLPKYAQKLGEMVRGIKRMAEGAKDRLRDEMGSEFDEVDWKQLDPRQYDPRRIIRDALLEDEREAHAEARKARAIEAAQARQRRQQAAAGEIATVFDDQAT